MLNVIFKLCQTFSFKEAEIETRKVEFIQKAWI